MTVDMEQPNSCSELQGEWQAELRTFLNPLLEVHPILTHNVIHEKRNWYVFHIIRQHVADAVVHIYLPIRSVVSSVQKRI
jgi:hypothetical protein